MTALARRGKTPPPCTAPAGWRRAYWRGPGCTPARPPAAVYLFDVSFSDTNLVSAAAAAKKVHNLSI